MGIFSFVKPGKKIFKTITSVKPKVNKNKLDKAKSNLAIATQKRKGAEAKLAQTLFEGKNKSFKKQDDFTFATTKRKTPKVSEQKAKGGRVGLKRGTGLRRPSNVEKIKKAFGPKEKPQTRMTRKKKKFPDLTGDGKVTFADILKGRGVINGKKKKKVI
jgi:hypothetical protein